MCASISLSVVLPVECMLLTAVFVFLALFVLTFPPAAGFLFLPPPPPPSALLFLLLLTRTTDVFFLETVTTSFVWLLVYFYFVFFRDFSASREEGGGVRLFFFFMCFCWILFVGAQLDTCPYLRTPPSPPLSPLPFMTFVYICVAALLSLDGNLTCF